MYVCTVEASICVGAVGIGVARMDPHFTLINICIDDSGTTANYHTLTEDELVSNISYLYS